MRGRAGAELTAAGRVFLQEAKRLLHMSKRAIQATSSAHSGIDLPLRFGYSPFVKHQLVEDVMGGYRDLAAVERGLGGAYRYGCGRTS